MPLHDWGSFELCFRRLLQYGCQTECKSCTWKHCPGTVVSTMRTPFCPFWMCSCPCQSTIPGAPEVYFGCKGRSQGSFRLHKPFLFFFFFLWKKNYFAISWPRSNGVGPKEGLKKTFGVERMSSRWCRLPCAILPGESINIGIWGITGSVFFWLPMTFARPVLQYRCFSMCQSVSLVLGWSLKVLATLWEIRVSLLSLWQYFRLKQHSIFRLV